MKPSSPRSTGVSLEHLLWTTWQGLGLDGPRKRNLAGLSQISQRATSAMMEAIVYVCECVRGPSSGSGPSKTREASGVEHAMCRLTSECLVQRFEACPPDCLTNFAIADRRGGPSATVVHGGVENDQGSTSAFRHRP